MKNNTIFFLTIPLYGHVFPVLDVINKVGKEGYNTYCFVNDFFAEYIKNDNVSVICYPEKVIANFNTKSSNLLEDEHISYYHLNYTSNNIEWSAISSKYLYEYMYDYMMKYVKQETFQDSKWIASAVGGAGIERELIERKYFDNMIEMEFEGKRFYAPEGYEKYLTNLYGDYMQMPPKEKRVASHRGKIWWK